MVVPIGKIPSFDKDLKEMLKRLPEDASIEEFCKIVDKWENNVILRDKEVEQRAKSGRLAPIL